MADLPPLPAHHIEPLFNHAFSTQQRLADESVRARVEHRYRWLLAVDQLERNVRHLESTLSQSVSVDADDINAESDGEIIDGIAALADPNDIAMADEGGDDQPATDGDANGPGTI